MRPGTVQPHNHIRVLRVHPFLIRALKFLSRANRRRLSDERNLTRIRKG